MAGPRRRVLGRGPGLQRGMVVLVALVVLLLMGMGALSAMRSVFTGNGVSGNLAFQKSAAQAGALGVERAIAWLQATAAASPATLLADQLPAGPTLGYFASRQRAMEPNDPASWEPYWSALTATGRVNRLPRDDGGNTVSFVIQRLCNAAGPREAGVECASGAGAPDGNSKGAQVPRLDVPQQYYYRITARIDGPRNTVAYVQAVVAQ